MSTLWRWLRCRTGHHRETVDVVREWRPDTAMGLPGCFRLRSRLRLRCLHCPHEATLCEDVLFTPSRRYALRRPQGRAA